MPGTRISDMTSPAPPIDAKVPFISETAGTSNYAWDLGAALYINVKDYREDSDTDDRNAIIAAAAYAKSLRTFDDSEFGWRRRQVVLYFPPNIEFEISEPVQISANVSVIMEAALQVAADADAVPSDFGAYTAWIEIGGDAVAYNKGSRGCRYVINVQRVNQSDWHSLDDLGVRFRDIIGSDIRITRINGFCRNTEWAADSFAFFDNEIHLGELRGAKRHITVTAVNAAPFNDQFCNKNEVFGGAFANGAGEGDVAQISSADPLVGIWFKAGNTAGYDSNTFVGQSYELSGLGGAEDEMVLVWLEGKSISNDFQRQRTEGTSGSMLITHAESAGNAFEDTYYSYNSTEFEGRVPTISDSSTAKANLFVALGEKMMSRMIPVWDSGLIARASNQYDGGTGYAIGGFDIAGSDFTQYAGQDGITISGDVVSYGAGRNPIRWLDTSVSKRFVFMVDTGDRTKGWNPRFRAYDSGGTILADATPDHVRGENASTLAWNADAFGVGSGAYVAAGDIIAYFLYISVSDETKKLAFILTGGAGKQIKGAKIFALDSPCSSWVEARSPFDNGEFIATAIPTESKPTGTTVWQIDATVGQPLGWRRTATPAWVPLANL
jgi:hypothetical protein